MAWASNSQGLTDVRNRHVRRGVLDRLLEVDIPLPLQEISNGNEMVLIFQLDPGNRLGSVQHLGRLC
jgi:hypothetical protein